MIHIDFAIDRGGTFTDVYAQVSYPDIIDIEPRPQVKKVHVLKLLSVDPENYADAPREGIRRILERVTGDTHPKDELLNTRAIRSIRMGTCVCVASVVQKLKPPQMLKHNLSLSRNNRGHECTSRTSGGTRGPRHDRRIRRSA